MPFNVEQTVAAAIDRPLHEMTRSWQHWLQTCGIASCVGDTCCISPGLHAICYCLLESICYWCHIWSVNNCLQQIITGFQKNTVSQPYSKAKLQRKSIKKLTLSTIDVITSGFFKMCCPIPLLNNKPVKTKILWQYEASSTLSPDHRQRW